MGTTYRNLKTKNMIQYAFGYGWFLLGAALHILIKIRDYKAMAEANPDPKVIYSAKSLLDKEWINIAIMLVGGVALVLLMPKLVGGSAVDIKNITGQVVATIAMQTLLMPLYFFIGYSGNSALFALFGTYKKTLLNQIGVDSK